MRSVMADLTAYPIIFSAPMVKALLDGRKSQTRRMAWRHSTRTEGVGLHILPSVWQKRHDKFRAGERPWLWCRETWSTWMIAPALPGIGGKLSRDPDDWLYGADKSSDWDDMKHDQQRLRELSARREDGKCGNWIIRPSIHMPKWASRLSLRVTDMRMERLQDISHVDAVAEGVGIFPQSMSAQKRFTELWNSIHGSGAWVDNPEVVVTVFEPHLQNIGSVT